MEEFLSIVGITQTGEKSAAGDYVVDFSNDREFMRASSILDRSSLVEEVESASVVNESMSSIVYMSDDYVLTLIADFDQGTYRLIVSNK